MKSVTDAFSDKGVFHFVGEGDDENEDCDKDESYNPESEKEVSDEESVGEEESKRIVHYGDTPATK